MALKEFNYRLSDSCFSCKYRNVNYFAYMEDRFVACSKHDEIVDERAICDDFEKWMGKSNFNLK